MKLELTPEQVRAVLPLIQQCESEPVATRLCLGQVLRSDWRDPGKMFFTFTTITSATGRKIRKLIETEREPTPSIK